MTRLYSLFAAFALFASLSAQTPYISSSDILQKLQQLKTVGSVLYIAAHPDDENTRLLPYLTKERKLRTAYLSLTRGDGGQNLIGKEQGEALGVLRTQELLAARRIDGAEQFFTRANDFGFSKNPEETFAIWNKDSVLSDVVWVIRTFKPDVIITRFPTTGEGGHGHHTASAILAVEAFKAAADPARFPDQLKYTQVWQARRLFWNTFNFGALNLTSEDQLKVDIGGYNALLGKSYGEIASDNRSMHKSQGFGTAKTRGQNFEYFKQLDGTPALKDPFENLNTTWNRFPETKKLDKALQSLLEKFDPLHPEKSVAALSFFYRQLQQTNSQDSSFPYWKNEKLKEAEQLLIACAGLWMEAYASEYTIIPDRTLTLTVQAVQRNPSNAMLTHILYADQDSSLNLAMKTNELYSFKHTQTLAAGTSYSDPYWLKASHGTGLYTVQDQQLIGKPENDPAQRVKFTFRLNDLTLTVERPVVYKYTDPVKGERYRPLEVLPPATVNVSEKVYVYNDTLPKPITCIVKANEANVSGKLQWLLPPGWTGLCAHPEFVLHQKGDEAVLEVQVYPGSQSIDGDISLLLVIGKDTLKQGITRIEYDHIPYQFMLSEASARLVHVDLRTAGKHIGYIPGAGDDVVACLKQVGYEVTLLTDDLLDKGKLSAYDAIVTGIRAYNTNDRLQVYYNVLMDYVKQGGNLVVQYNTNNRIGPLLAKIGPYPFTISRDRVTVEEAKVELLLPQHPAFRFPNTISDKDFEDWIQERGIYFATELDDRYQTLLSMNDPGEQPSHGSLIVAPYGKGNFVYTGLSFFRELPAGVPGAYRLFVNLLSLPPHP